jgi:hypothetical protein
MLELDDRKRAAAELIASLPCEVEFSDQSQSNLDKAGGALSSNTKRRYPRVNCRSERNRAGLQYQPTLPHLDRPSDWRAVYVINLSREGVGFLSGVPLYPCEEMRILLLSGVGLKLEVIRCRRLRNHCFEIGARIISRDDEQPSTGHGHGLSAGR